MTSEEPQPSDAPESQSNKYDIKHMPRKKASGPRFDALPEYKAPPPPPPPKPVVYDDPVQKIANLTERRIGPDFVKYSCWTGGAAVAYTYLNGFRSMMLKDKFGWENSFRQRILILAPLFSMYFAGSGLLPIPFRSKLEELTGRAALSLQDFSRADRIKKEEEKQARDAAEAEASALSS